MPNYERKTIPFVHKGMNWNAPPDKTPEGQIPWVKNGRVLEQGVISSAHGHTQAFSPTGYQYLHSISRLNIKNPQFDPFLARNYVVGGDQNLLVFRDDPTLHSGLNPVITPKGQYNVFSGNPLSIVDAQPVGAAAAWKYIADSKQMVAVGYYPGDTHNTMARCLTIGMRQPINRATVTKAGAGKLLGQYQWAFAYRNLQTGARSNPSSATRHQLGGDPNDPDSKISVHMVNESASMPLPDVPLDPQTGQPDANIVIDVYRFGGTINRWALVGSGHAFEVFVDNVPDLQLLAAPGPSMATDASTGLTRFNLFQPFVTQDIARKGSGALARMPNGEWILNTIAGDPFNLDWLQGSTIYIGRAGSGAVGTAYTIYEVGDPNNLVVAENLEGSFSVGDPVDWSTNAGTLMSGQPMSHLWGPYGIGQSGSYLFACGDPNAPGTLYWTNGNDPDSTDIVNNIIVTSPSERLQTGCVYDGQPFCWSTERQFQIFPSLTVFGQFTTQEIAGAKGVWMEWSLSVQSNGFADQSVTWRGKDGIYDWSAGGGLRRLTDDLYPFFPHDGEFGFAPETIMPFINYPLTDHPEVVGNLDDRQPKYHRTCWFHGMLFYDFVAQSQDGQTYSTLVWDEVQVKGWVSLDQAFPHTHAPVARGVEIGANDPDAGDTVTPDGSPGAMGRGGNLKVTWGDIIYDYYGYTRGFETRIVTRAEDFGDPRANKLFGDYWFDCTAYSLITIIPLVNFHRSQLEFDQVPFSIAGIRRQHVLDFDQTVTTHGIGVIQQTMGLDIRWIASDGPFTASINQWSPAIVPKPESISFRFTDRSDEGVVQAKYLMGMNLEADTGDTSFLLNVMVDGNLIAQVNIQHDGQTEKPYAWEPVAGYEFQVQMNFPQEVLWRLFKIQWIYEPWPDAVARKYPFQSLGTTGAKYIRGIVMPMETGGQPGTVHLWGDDADTDYTWTKTTEELKKTGEVLDLPAPFVAHFIQFSTLTDSRIWPAEVKVDFDPWPEMSTDVSSFTNLGYQGAKFFQGVVFSAETGGRQVSITVNSDCGHSVKLPLVQTPALCKNNFAFSFSPCNNPPSEPFIAEQVQIVPDGDIRIWNDETRYVWEPEPELVATYQTQPTDHDLPGWHSMRDCYIAYRGGSGAPTLYITTEYGTESYLLDYVGPNVYTRCYRVLKPQKAKWRHYRVEGCGLIRLYIKDCEVRVKAWGSTGAYISAQPFGELSRTNGGARI